MKASRRSSVPPARSSRARSRRARASSSRRVSMGAVALPEVRTDSVGGHVVSSRLSLLVDLSSLLAREVDLDALLQTACERVAQALHADRATIWLLDAENGDLVTRVAMLPEVPKLR